MPLLTAALKQKALELGFDSAGVCAAVTPPHWDAYRTWLDKGYEGQMDYLKRHLPLKEHPNWLLPGARSVVAVALNYNQPSAWEKGQPKIARYALGRDYHKVLRQKLRRLSAWLETTLPGVQSRACVDSAPIMERDFAQLAGLGWFGKNTCLIDSKRGSWFFIGLLLTTVEMEPDAPAKGSCGTCRKCIDACPTGAIVFEDDRWQIDARRCISYLTIEHRGPIPSALEKGIGDWTFGCDVCQEVCPFNEPRPTQPERGKSTKVAEFLNARRWPNLTELAQIEEPAWDVLTRGSPLRRAGLEGISRNAEINLRADLREAS